MAVRTGAFAAALLCGLGLAFAGPALAQQQRTLVSNILQSDHGTVAGQTFNNQDFAQAFTTGPNPGGYWLEEVELEMVTVNSSGDPAANPTVTIRAESATGTVQATLTGPTELRTTRRKFTAPSPPLLHPETTYWIRAESSNGDLRWKTTAAAAEDAAFTAPLWSIADYGQRRQGAATAYSNYASQRAFKFSLVGRERRENVPATGLPRIYGPAVARQTLRLNLWEVLDANGLDNLTENDPTIEWRTTRGPGKSGVSSTFSLTDAHVGAKVRVWVWFDDDDGYREEFLSAEYPVNGTVRAHNDPAADSPPTGAVAIEGASLFGGTVPATGDNLFANTEGLRDPDGGLNRIEFGYRWTRLTPTGSVVAKEGGQGFGFTYRVKDADVGSQLRVDVTAVDQFGGSATVMSNPTEIVSNRAMACARPDLTGRRVVWQNTVQPAWITSGTLLAEQSGARRDLGYDGAYSGAGELSSGWVDFRAGLSREYTLDGAWLRGDGELHLVLASGQTLTSGDRRKLRLHVCGGDFDLAAAEIVTVLTGQSDSAPHRSAYHWENPKLDWTLEDGVTEGGRPYQQVLRLSVPDAPAPQSASANGRQVTLAFDQDRRLGPNNFPHDPAEAFTLALEGGTAPNVASGVVDGNLVILTLDKAVNADGSGAYTLRYDRPVSSLSGTLRDTDGIEVESFADLPVRNRTLSNRTVLPAGSARVLLTNLEQALIGSWGLGSDRDLTQGFFTGGHPGGYDLTGIELRLTNNDEATMPPTVKLFSGSAAGKEVARFSGPRLPGVRGDVDVLFTPVAPAILEPATRYWIVVEQDAEQAKPIFWSFTTSLDSDAPPAPGWRRSGGYGERKADATGAFTFESGLYKKMALHGAPRAFATGRGAAAGQPDGIRVEAADGGVRVHWRPPKWHRHATSHLLYDLRYRIGGGEWTDGPRGIRGEFLGDEQDGTRWAVLPGVAGTANLEVQVTARSADATLVGLALEDDDGNRVALSPGFSPATRSYKARTQFTDEVTVAPTPGDDGAAVEILDGSGRALADANPGRAGHQVTLARMRDTDIRIRVTSESTNALTYNLTVRRMPDHCDLADPKELWCGLVTVGEGTLSGTQFQTRASGAGYSKVDAIGSLWPAEFDYRTETIAVDIIWISDNQFFNIGIKRVSGTTPSEWLLGDGSFAFDSWLPDGTRKSEWIDNAMLNTFWVPTDTEFPRNRTIPTKLFLVPKGSLFALDIQDEDATMEVAAPSPAVHWDTGSYTASVRHAVDTILVGVSSEGGIRDTVEYLDANGMAIQDSDGNKLGHQIALAVGENTIKVKVTADTGATRTYTLVITRAPATSDATLALLDFSELGESGRLLNPAFSPAHETYTAWARNAMDQVTILAWPNDDSAVVEYLDGDDTAIGDADSTEEGHQAALSVGTNTIKVKVTASDTTTVKTYTVTVTRAAADADPTLASLGSGLRAVEFRFEWPLERYATSVENAVAEITLTPTTSQTGATVAYLDGGDSPIADADSTEDGHQVALSEGENTIKVKVTAGNGTTERTYTLVVRRLAPNLVSNNLQSPDDAINGLGMAQAFATGAHSNGYGLDSIGLSLGEVAAYSISSDGGIALDADFMAALHRGSRTGPKVADFFTHTLDHSANAAILTPTAEVTLGPSTAYFLVLSDDLAAFPWAVTTSDAEDATPAAGWTIADESEVRLFSDDSWQTDDGNVFQISVNGRPVVTSDATLRALALADGDGAAVALSPAFAAATESYAAAVAADVAEITVAPTTSDGAATVAYLDGGDAAIDDADDMEAGQQVALEPGTNLIKIKVTASDAATEKTYVLAVARGAATLVSNWGQTGAGNSDAERRAQAFTTGAHADGYLLDRIVLNGTFITGSGNTATLHEGSRTGTKTADFTSEILDNESLKLTPTAEVTLSASTTYFVVTANDFNSGSDWLYTDSDDEDAVSADDWTVADTLEWYQTSSSSWQTSTSSALLAVFGAPADGGGSGGRGARDVGKTDQGETGKPGGLRAPGLPEAPDPPPVTETLTAVFENVPASHDGATAFEMQLRFSEEVNLSYKAFAAGLFEIAGGAVGTARRLAPPSNIGWSFPVTPSGDADVVLTLPAGRACDPMTGPCTEEGTQLSQAASATIAGPGETAAFSVTAGRGEIPEGASTQITVAISNGVVFAEDQAIALSAAGAAASSDYTLYPLTLTLTAGAASAASQFDALEDNLDESDETVTISASRGGDAIGSVTVTITEPPDAEWGERQPDNDIDLDSDAKPTGAWSDGSSVWVISDWEEGEVRVYDLSGGTEDANRGIELSGLGFPAALWSDGATLWVADFNGGVKAFGLADGAARTAEDFDADVMSAAGNATPSGLWSDGDTMWVADYAASKAFAYRLSDKTRLAARDIALEKRPGETYFPFGLWSNGATLLVSDWGAGELVGYALSGGARAVDRDIDVSAAGIDSPAGLVSDGSTLWVVDDAGKRLAAFAAP